MEALVGLALLLGCAGTVRILRWLSAVVPPSEETEPHLSVHGAVPDPHRGPLVAELTSDHADILLR
jgi:hypothetical protein